MRKVFAFGLFILLIFFFDFISSLNPQRQETFPRKELSAHFNSFQVTQEDIGLLQFLTEIPKSDTVEIRTFLSDNYRQLREVMDRSLTQILFHSVSGSTNVSHEQLQLTREVAERLAKFRDEPVHKNRISFFNGLSDEEKWRLLAADYLLFQANAHRRNRETSKAQTLFEKVQRFYYQLGDKVGSVNTLYSNGLLCYQIDQFRLGVGFFGQAATLAQNIGDIYMQFRALKWLGVIQKNLRNFEDATETLQVALELANKLEDDLLRAKAQSALASVYEETGAIFLAQEMLNGCLHIYRLKDEISDEAVVYRRLGFVYQDFGDYERALECQIKSLELFTKLDDLESQMLQYNNIGIINAEMGNLIGAREAFETAIDTAAAHNYSAQRGIFHANLGKVFSEFDDFDNAYHHLGLAIKYGDESNRPDFYMVAGEVRLKEKKWHRAKHDFLQAVAGFRQSDYKIGLISSLLGLGESNLQLEDSEKALANFNEAIGEAVASNLLSLLWQGYYGKARVLEQQADYDKAIKSYAYAIDIIEKERDRLHGLQTRLEFFAERQKVYDAAILCYFEKMKDDKKAFEFAERAKARAFLDMIHGAVQIENSTTGDSSFRAKVTSHAIQVTDLEDIQSLLQADDLMVEYRVLPDRILIWLVDNISIKSEQIFIKREQLQSLVKKFREAIGAEDPDKASDKIAANPKKMFDESVASGRELSQYLLKPIWSAFKNRGMIYIIPDDVLHYVPFAALLQPDSDSRFLIELAPLVAGPSSSVLSHVMNKNYVSSNGVDISVLAVADPDSELEGARQTAKYIASKYSNTRLLIGRDAVKDSVLQNFKKPSDLIHIGVHVTIDEGAPLQTTMHLFNPGKAANSDSIDLKMYEIFNTKLDRTRAVILSGCKTAMGRFVRGEGFVGLTRAFITVGVPTVMVTLWEIDDKVTDELMQDYYDNLNVQQHNFAAALRQAQLARIAELRDDSVFQFAHPFFWSAFVAVGKAH